MAYFHVEVGGKDSTVIGYIEASSIQVAKDYAEYKFPDAIFIKVNPFTYSNHGRLDDYAPVV